MTGTAAEGKLAAVRRGLALLVVLALAGSGCGRDPETDHIEEIRALCAELAATSAGTAEAGRLLGAPSLVLCGGDLLPASSADRCPYRGTPICIRVWAWRARSASLCGGQACSYGCELRAPDGAPEDTCSVRFLEGYEVPGLPAS